MVDTFTRPLSRNQLSKIVGGDHEAIKFLENLASDVGQTLPDAVTQAQEAAAAAQVAADQAQDAAQAAQLASQAALDAVNNLSALIDNSGIDSFPALLESLRAMIKRVDSKVNQALEGPP